MHNTKRSLLTSLTSLLLCFVMLIGTTFAWFTDEVTSANNIIKAGKLDIGMHWSTDNSNWANAEGINADPVFDYDNWEPGYTEVRYIKVTNDGNLAFKYQMFINPTGTVGKLAEVIDVSYDVVTGNANFVAPNATNKKGSLTKVGTLNDLIASNDAIGGGVLLPDGVTESGYYTKEIVVCISFHMQELAGNEYQGASIGDAFGINLYATQFDYESDSFDNSYDDNAEWPDRPINSSASASIDNNNITLGALTNEVTISGNGISATVPADVKVADGTTSLNLTVQSADADGNLSLGEGATAKGFNVHIDGIAADNTQPMIVNLGAVLPTGLTDTELKLYHTENGTPVLMTRVNSAADFSIHNQYTYDSATGKVSIYVASFSVFSAVKTSADVWDGTSADDTWYDESKTEFTLTSAAQFVGFRNLVDAGTTFEGKTVKLGVDIDLDNKPFDPIGFGYWYEKNVVEGKDQNTVFMGTFDGGNHTIYNLYENCWELDPDKENYSTYTYSTAGAGLFASIKNATIKNLAVSGAEIVFECVDMGVVVGYAQGSCHFENIVVTDSKIANYNRYTGGLVGEVSYGPYGIDTSLGYSHTFKNITVDSSVTVSGLWGSFGCGMGGVIGGKWGDATVKMENVVSAPVMDVYNDVVSAYQWYAFRGCGMLIGHTEEPYSDGRHSGNATASFLKCENVKVYYGDWAVQNYYRFSTQTDKAGNPLWYSNYPWVRAEAGEYCDAFSNIRYGIPQIGGVKVTEIAGTTAEKLADEHVEITFDQLYGADRGMYGTATHEGVTTVYKNTKTIYFQNNWNWTNLKLHYWCENGEDRWTTVVDGINVSNLTSTKIGGYDVYTFEMPAYVAGFKIEGFDSTTHTTHSIPEVSAEGIVEGNIYWFVYANGEYSISTSALKNNNTFDTHEIYLVGTMNNWTVGDGWKLTPSADGKTWTGTFTIDKASDVKLYNAKVLFDQAAYIAQKDIENNKDTSLAPGKYKFTYSVSDNEFTFTMIERILYLTPTTYWTKNSARFAVYAYNSNSDYKWYDMTKQSDGTYKVSIDPKYANVIFCRMNGANATNNWNNRWSQTPDIAVSNLANGSYNVADVKFIYLKPNSDWKQSSAWFAAYFFDNGETWQKMTDYDGDGIYECIAPSGYPKVIFVRMNSGNKDWLSFDNKWNQTGNLTIPTNGNNLFTIKQWDNQTTGWSKNS